MLRSKIVWKLFLVLLLILFLSFFLSLKARTCTVAACGDQRLSWEETATDIASYCFASDAGDAGLEGAALVSPSNTVGSAASLLAQHVCRAPPEYVRQG